MTKLFDIHADEPNGGGSFGVWSWRLRDQSPKKKGAFSCSFAPFIWHLSKRKLFGEKGKKFHFQA